MKNTDHLYRIRFGDNTAYAVLDGHDFLLVELSNPRKPVLSGPRVSKSLCTILPPSRPTKIVAVGLNYRDHAAERNKPIPEEPLLFIKPSTAVIANGETIVMPPASKRVDPEGELAIVILKDASRIASPREAADYIWGYSVMNDVTARDLQDKDVQFTRAKSFDTFAPYGPCLALNVDPSDLAIVTRVNGETRQNSRTSQLIFKTDFLVWYVSQIMTLLHGDVITTGTPSGIAPINEGDVVEVELENIGILSNPVAKAPVTAA